MKSGCANNYKLVLLILLLTFTSCTVAYWLRHYATNRKVAGSRPDEVNF
jgi:hypothetical protein